jgi:hypothetical protein
LETKYPLTLPIPTNLENLKIKNKNKNKKTENSPLKAGRIGAPSTYCIMQNADFQPKPNLFFQTQLISLFFQNKVKQETICHQKWELLGSLRQAKVTQASDPESGELNSEDAPAKPLTFDSDSFESTPRHTFKEGFTFNCTHTHKKNEYIKK